MALHILFVCTGNICRSAMAERLAAALSAESGMPDLVTSSAGTRAVIGNPIHPDAAAVLAGRGCATGDFAARQINARIASNADLILTMTRAHRDAVLELAPRQLRRTFTLQEAASLAGDPEVRDIGQLAGIRARIPSTDFLDIPDPIGQSGEVFAAIGTRIADLIPAVLTVCRTTGEGSGLG